MQFETQQLAACPQVPKTLKGLWGEGKQAEPVEEDGTLSLLTLELETNPVVWRGRNVFPSSVLVLISSSWVPPVPVKSRSLGTVS